MPQYCDDSACRWQWWMTYEWRGSRQESKSTSSSGSLTGGCGRMSAHAGYHPGKNPESTRINSRPMFAQTITHSLCTKCIYSTGCTWKLSSPPALSQPLELLCSILKIEEDHDWFCLHRDSTLSLTGESHRLTYIEAQMRTDAKSLQAQRAKARKDHYTLWLTSHRDHFAACVCFM